MKGGLIAINKPSGRTSAQCLNELKKIISNSELAQYFRPAPPHPNDRNRRRRKSNRLPDIKIGHGGTLDPLASGVLVVGLGTGTKQLSSLLSCMKTYRATALFGCSTDTYDSAGKIIKIAVHIPTKEEILSGLDAFRGDISQLPPLYSALHIQGKRLYEYAREGIPLPESIKARSMHCEELILKDFIPKEEHTYTDPDEFASKEAIESEELLRPIEGGAERHDLLAKTEQDINPQDGDEKINAKSPTTNSVTDVAKDQTVTNPKKRKFEVTDLARGSRPAIGPIAVLDMTVSSGFYVRSLIHDLGRQVNSEAHMVDLVRLKQGSFALDDENCFDFSEFSAPGWEEKLAAAFKIDLKGDETS
ncbi:tRNA pseudouridine synthase [Schizosaccharomyces pombe]